MNLDWLGLVLAVLKFANLIMGFVNSEQQKQAGRDEEIAKTAAAILRKTAAGKAIMEKVDALSDADVDAELRGLEPK